MRRARPIVPVVRLFAFVSDRGRFEQRVDGGRIARRWRMRVVDDAFQLLRIRQAPIRVARI